MSILVPRDAEISVLLDSFIQVGIIGDAFKTIQSNLETQNLFVFQDLLELSEDF